MFSVKGQRGNIFCFEVIGSQLLASAVEHRGSCVPIRLYSQKQVSVQICPESHRLPPPVLEHEGAQHKVNAQ